MLVKCLLQNVHPRRCRYYSCCCCCCVWGHHHNFPWDSTILSLSLCCWFGSVSVGAGRSHFTDFMFMFTCLFLYLHFHLALCSYTFHVILAWIGVHFLFHGIHLDSNVNTHLSKINMRAFFSSSSHFVRFNSVLLWLLLLLLFCHRLASHQSQTKPIHEQMSKQHKSVVREGKKQNLPNTKQWR